MNGPNRLFSSSLLTCSFYPIAYPIRILTTTDNRWLYNSELHRLFWLSRQWVFRSQRWLRLRSHVELVVPIDDSPFEVLLPYFWNILKLFTGMLRVLLSCWFYMFLPTSAGGIFWRPRSKVRCPCLKFTVFSITLQTMQKNIKQHKTATNSHKCYNTTTSERIKRYKKHKVI